MARLSASLFLCVVLWIFPVTLSVVPIDQAGIENICDGIAGFSDPDEQRLIDTMMTTLFIGAGSEQTKNRCAYLLDDSGSRLYVPNRMRGWLVGVDLITQQYQDFDPTEKLLVKVVAADGAHYQYKTGLNGWCATSFLMNFKHMTRQQLADQIQITLVPKGRCVFANVEYCTDGQFRRVEIPKECFGQGKYSYDQILDAISWTNGTAQTVEDSGVIEAQVTPDEEPFDVAPEELDEVLESIRQPTKRRSKSSKSQSEATSA